jgi:CspA family cold shock protein
MEQGRVKFYNDAKGFGFIRPDAGGNDVFVHISQIIARSPLQDGDVVQYDVEINPKSGKTQATKVGLVRRDNADEYSPAHFGRAFANER